MDSIFSPTYSLVWVPQIPQRELPFGFLRQPFGFFHLLPKSQVLVHVVLPRQALPVLPDLMALREFLRPLRVGRKAGLVDMGGNVASHAGIRVFVPLYKCRGQLTGELP